MRHIPVLLNEVISSLHVQPGMNIIDCTLGDSGHAEEILKKISPSGTLLGLDADQESLSRAKEFLKDFKRNAILVHANFAQLLSEATRNSFTNVDGIVMDLGWSTPQFKERGRGFSFEADEPLDMRYDQNSTKTTAKDILNTFTVQELEKIFRLYAEEKFSSSIAVEIGVVRKGKPLETTQDLVKIIVSVYQTKIGSKKDVPWIGGIHPATRVFQALRIAVNNELGVLKQVLPDAVSLLKSGGCLAVISFHSLEDRIVKHFFQTLPTKNFTIVTKKPIIASAEELVLNPKSRSAKLRVIQKK